MKRIVCMILLCGMILSGCSVAGERIKEPVTFYYVAEDYQKNMDEVIISEIREAAGHKNDLSYLLALYSMGPVTEELNSILPRNTSIRLENHTEEGLELRLSESALTMTESDYALACTCISLTCMNLTDVPQVTVACGERSITIQKNRLLLDNQTGQKITEETK